MLLLCRLQNLQVNLVFGPSRGLEMDDRTAVAGGHAGAFSARLGGRRGGAAGTSARAPSLQGISCEGPYYGPLPSLYGPCYVGGFKMESDQASITGTSSKIVLFVWALTLAVTL